MGDVVSLSQPTFTGFLDALSFYSIGSRVTGLRNEHRPPIDATGNDTVDAYTCTVFAALTKMPATLRLEHLLDKAAQCERIAADSRNYVGPDRAQRLQGAADYDRAASILRGWADQMHAAMVRTPTGGDAA